MKKKEQKFIDAVSNQVGKEINQAYADALVWGYGYIRFSSEGEIKCVNMNDFEKHMMELVTKKYE